MFYLSGNENLIMDVEKLKEVPHFKELNLQREHIINKAHGDEITVVPDFFINVGTSASCKVINIHHNRMKFLFQMIIEFSAIRAIQNIQMKIRRKCW